jgi:hypothetical protein
MVIVYRVEVQGRMPDGAANEFPTMAISVSDRVTTLVGELADSSALYGVIARLEALGLNLIAARPDPPAGRAGGQVS